MDIDALTEASGTLQPIDYSDVPDERVENDRKHSDAELEESSRFNSE